MKKLANKQSLIAVLVMIGIMFLPVFGQAQSILSKSLVDNSDHLVYYERDASGMIHFFFEDLGATSRDGDGSLDLYIDYNQNNKIDLLTKEMSAGDYADLDRAFSISRKNNSLCPRYIYSPSSASGCGQFPSGAQSRGEFKSTRNASQQHICWEITVPTKELALAHNDNASVVIRFCRAPGDCKVYPEQTGEMFSQVYTVEW